MKKTLIFLISVILLLTLCACGAGSQKVDQAELKQQMDDYIAELCVAGTIDALKETWCSSEAKTRTLYYETLPAENGKLTMGTAINTPFSCYENGHYGGVAIELVYMFCEKNGYGLDVVGYSDINAAVMAVAAGKCDIGGTTITITEERKKSVDFSACYCNDPFVVRVREENAADYSSLEDFSGKTIGVLAGSVIPVVANQYLPDCEQYEYNSLTDIFYAVSQGKVDAGVTNIILNSELLSAFPDVVQSVDIPYDNPFGLIYPKENRQNTLSSVLYRTFIENERWSIFLNGILTTLEISGISILFGTALGFAVYYYILRRPRKVSKMILDVVLWIIRCTPVVLFLLIFYYIVFGNTDISGIIVCITAFTVIFSSSFLGCFTAAMNTVDPGQNEVSLSLGYTPRQSFFRIILPQALSHFWPNYRNAVINHIKATSIVGYVAVVDVTKAGDMIRSSTYDALVPLVSAAVFYFLVIFLITFLIRLIRIGTEASPKRRKRRLKGVREHD